MRKYYALAHRTLKTQTTKTVPASVASPGNELRLFYSSQID